MSDNIFSGEIDPEIADLMEIEDTAAPDFDDLFEEEGGVKKQQRDEVDINRKAFSPINKFHEDRPVPLFSSKDYYK